MSLTPPLKVGKLQTALHTKAKNSPDYRFYALYDKVYRRDVLAWAYVRCLRNGGVPGVDGQSFDDIEKSGRDQWLDELADELRKERTNPGRSGACSSPKGMASKGRWVSLASETVWCRRLSMLVLEPIFEADLEPEQHAYRPERTALDAVRLVERLVRSGHTEVVDADLSGYFDSIPHAELMKSVSRRVSDGRVLRLIKMWLEAPVEETDGKGTAIGRPGTRTRESAARKGLRFHRCSRMCTCDALSRDGRREGTRSVWRRESSTMRTTSSSVAAGRPTRP